MRSMKRWFARTRLGLAIHVLRGRPLMYKMNVKGTFDFPSHGPETRMQQCNLTVEF